MSAQKANKRNLSYADCPRPRAAEELRLRMVGAASPARRSFVEISNRVIGNNTEPAIGEQRSRNSDSSQAHSEYTTNQNVMKTREASMMPNSARAKRYLLSIVAALLILTGIQQRTIASEPCDPPNVIPRSACDMDSFHAAAVGEVPDGWTEFVLSGNPTYSEHYDTVWGPPSLMIRTFDEAFEAGIYAQVRVQPGAGYRASISWGAPNTPDTFGRQLGLDPAGGTDPKSPTVIWGPTHWGPGRILNYPPPDVNIDVRGRAAGDTMTVFFRVDHVENPGDNLIFIDVIALYPDESAPPLETSTPTPEPTTEPTTEPTPEPTSEPTRDPPGATPVDDLFLPLLSDVNQAQVIVPTATPTATLQPHWSEPVRIAGDRAEELRADFGSQPAVVEDQSGLLVAYSLSHGDGGQSGDDEAYLTQYLASSGWQEPMALTDVDPGQSAGPPSIVMDSDGQLHAVWIELTNGVGISSTYATRGSDLAWSPPQPLPELEGYRTVDNNGTHALVELADDAIGVAWLGESSGGNEVMWTARTENGWSVPAAVSDNTDSAGNSAGFPSVARSGDSFVHAVWNETSGGTKYALLDTSTLAWTLPVTTELSAGQFHTLVAGDSGSLHLLTQTTDGISYAYVGQETGWGEAKQEKVAEESIDPYYGLSSLAVDSEGNAHAVWIHADQIRYAVRGPESDWSAPVTLFTRSWTGSAYLYLLVDGSGDLHLLFHDDQEIWYSNTS